MKGLVALALIPSGDVHLAFCKILETLPTDSPLIDAVPRVLRERLAGSIWEVGATNYATAMEPVGEP